ncbi:MAG: alkaline phosphatase [Hyperionvirus sp.]|uniref:Alkaline phosphatase n=1 Tax=Hyperionvirus sp. TaxID=2487770 RepID=A0A3G5AF19_9VIRU|nr:MAG: alkaline phosphatase [Hyperionvirus sp.]
MFNFQLYIIMIILLIIDGVLADYLKDKSLHNFQYMFKNSAWSLNMKISYPSITEPSISAILHGVDALFLECYYDNVRKYCQYDDYPEDAVSIFKALQPLKTAVVGTWLGLTRELVNPKDITEDFSWKSTRLDAGVIEKAGAIIQSGEFKFLLVYLEDPDHVGHESGVTQPYKDSLKAVDEKLGVLLKLIAPSDYLFIVSDHGRSVKSYTKGKSHHVFSEETNRVPFFAKGPNIKIGQIKNNYIHSTDIAPTILHLLHKKIPNSMRGRPLKDLFTNYYQKYVKYKSKYLTTKLKTRSN